MDYGFFDVMKMSGTDSVKPIREKSGPAVTGRFPSETPLAMVYVPYQTFDKIYDPEYALDRGTVFPELDFPLKNEGEDRI